LGRTSASGSRVELGLEAGDLGSGLSGRLGEVGVRDLEAPHGGAPLRLGVLRCGCAEGCVCCCQGRARLSELGLVEHLPRRVRHAPFGVIGGGRIGVEAVQGEVRSGVTEVVLLAPAREHPVGDLGRGGVEARGDNLGLMPVVGAPDDLVGIEGLSSRDLLRETQADTAIREVVGIGDAVFEVGMGGEGPGGSARTLALG